jgi:hypothetical protein
MSLTIEMLRAANIALPVHRIGATARRWAGEARLQRTTRRPRVKTHRPRPTTR